MTYIINQAFKYLFTQNNCFVVHFRGKNGCCTLIMICILMLFSFNSLAKDGLQNSHLKNIREYIKNDDSYHGVVLIAKGNHVLLEHASGFADRGQRIPHNINSKFQSASMAKMFTATAIMQLVEKGAIELTDTVGAYLPEYPNDIVKDKVTIHHLLTHQSGLSDYFNDEYDKYPKIKISQLSDFLPFFQNKPLNFIPGKGARYSNSGYLLLGLIIERVTGKDYYTYIKENIFDVANMKDTGWRKNEVVTGLSRNYVYSLEKMNWLEVGGTGEIGSSAGGAYSTANDFLNFAKAILSNQLVSEETLKIMTTDQNGHGYGYGFSLYLMDNQISFGHSGGAEGVAGNLDIFVDSDYVVITLSNHPPMEGWYQMRTLTRKEIGGNTKHTDRLYNTEKLLDLLKQRGLEKAKLQLSTFANKLSVSYMKYASKFHRRNNKNEMALDILKLVLEINPQDDEALAALGDIYQFKGKFELALKYYNDSLNIYFDDANKQKRDLIQKQLDE